MADKFIDAGVAAAMVHGEMSIKERDGIINSFSKGNINVLTFVSLIDEGLDIPEAAVMQFARPTKSIRLRRQLEGRVLRMHPDKEIARIIDQTDSWRHLPMPHEPVEWSLDCPREDGAKRKAAAATGAEVTERDPDSGVVERRSITPQEFREISRAASSWDLSRPPLIQAVESGSSAEIAECIRYRCSTPYGRGREVRSALAWPGLGSDHILVIGQAFGWSSWWVSKTVVEQAAVRSRRSLSTMKSAGEQGQARRTLRSAIDAAVAAGELAPAAVDNIELIGVLAGTEMVVAPLQDVVDRIHGDARTAAQSILERSLKDRVAPYSLTIGRLFHEPSRSERLAAAFG